jgi:hypothetical protein
VGDLVTALVPRARTRQRVVNTLGLEEELEKYYETIKCSCVVDDVIREANLAVEGTWKEWDAVSAPAAVPQKKKRTRSDTSVLTTLLDSLIQVHDCIDEEAVQAELRDDMLDVLNKLKHMADPTLAEVTYTVTQRAAQLGIEVKDAQRTGVRAASLFRERYDKNPRQRWITLPETEKRVKANVYSTTECIHTVDVALYEEDEDDDE